MCVSITIHNRQTGKSRKERKDRTRFRRDLNSGFRYSAEVACVAAAILPCVDRLTLSARTHETTIDQIAGEEEGGFRQFPSAFGRLKRHKSWGDEMAPAAPLTWPVCE